MAETLDTLRARLAAINEQLAGGVSSRTYQDNSMTFDLAELRRERDRIVREINGRSRSRYTRVTLSPNA